MPSACIIDDRFRISASCQFYRLLENRDWEGIMALWSDDAVIEMPYAPPMFPGRMTGSVEIATFWQMVVGDCQQLETNALQTSALAGTQQVLATYDGRSRLADNSIYENKYVCILHFDDAGKIKRYIEYYNPLAVMAAFGGDRA